MHLSTLRPAGRRMCVALAMVAVAAFMELQTCATWAQSPEPNSSDGAQLPVVTAIASARDVPTYLTSIGTVVASKTTVVRSGIEGELTEIDFTAGQRVQAGDLLARVNAGENPAQSGVTAPVSYELRSPASGIVGKPLHRLGDLVTPAERTGLVAIRQIDPIYVEFVLPRPALSALRRRGADGPVRVWAYGEDRVHPVAEGRLVLADNGSPRRAREGKLEATFSNEDHALLPGLRVKIQVRGTSDNAALTVPLSAVQRSASGYFVYLVTASRTAHIRPIALGTVTEGIAVVRDGLEPGDVVITDGQYQLTEGSRVAIVAGPQPPARRQGPWAEPGKRLQVTEK